MKSAKVNANKAQKKVHDNASSFAKSLKQLVPILKEKTNIAALAATGDLYVDVIKSTPAKTGRSKNSWFMGNTITDLVAPANDNSKSYGLTSEQIARMDSTEPTGKYWIWNNLSHMIHLEAGSSTLAAPGQMLANNLPKLEKYFVDRFKKPT